MGLDPSCLIFSRSVFISNWNFGAFIKGSPLHQTSCRLNIGLLHWRLRFPYRFHCSGHVPVTPTSRLAPLGSPWHEESIRHVIGGQWSPEALICGWARVHRYRLNLGLELIDLFATFFNWELIWDRGEVHKLDFTSIWNLVKDLDMFGLWSSLFGTDLIPVWLAMALNRHWRLRLLRLGV